MSRPSRSRLGSAAVVGGTAVAMVLGGACGGGPAPALRGDPTTLVRAAADRTISAQTARVTIALGVATGPGIVGSGVANLALGRAQLNFQRTGALAKTQDRFDLVVDGAEGYLAGTGPAAAGTLRMVQGSLPDLAAQARSRIAPLDALLVRPGAGTALAFLRGAQKVLPYGGQEVQGASTMRYSFVIDLAAAEAASPPGQRPALAAAAGAIGDVLEPADVWLDSNGRVRRVQFATDPKLHTTTTKPSLFAEDGEYLSFIDIDFSAFGSPAPVSLPPGGP